MLKREEFEQWLNGADIPDMDDMGKLLKLLACMSVVIRETNVATQVQNSAATEAIVALMQAGWLDDFLS